MIANHKGEVPVVVLILPFLAGIAGGINLSTNAFWITALLFPKQYVIIKTGQGNPVIAYAVQLRQNLVTKLKANMKDTTAIAVASTLILGYKADLSNDILQAYSKTGTIHILSVNRITDYKVYSLDNNIQSAYLIKQGGLVQFLNKRLVMLNHNIAITSIPQRLQSNYLYITNNAYADIATIAKSNMLIIDGSNTDKHVTKLSEAANKLNVNYKILGRNKSFTAISN